MIKYLSIILLILFSCGSSKKKNQKKDKLYEIEVDFICTYKSFSCDKCAQFEIQEIKNKDFKFLKGMIVFLEVNPDIVPTLKEKSEIEKILYMQSINENFTHFYNINVKGKILKRLIYEYPFAKSKTYKIYHCYPTKLQKRVDTFLIV